MKTCIMRQVVYRPPDSDKLTWAIVLGQNCGLSLLYVPRRCPGGAHYLALCEENIEERIFEPVDGPQFPIEDEDFALMGNRLLAIGERFEEKETEKMLEDLL